MKSTRPTSPLGKVWAQKYRKLMGRIYENMKTRNLVKKYNKGYERREALRNLGFLMEKITMETIETTENFKLLTEQQAAKVLKMSYSKIKYLRQQGKIGFVRFGCSIRYKLSQLQKFVELGIIEAKT
jgi:excisionase family DNA binding protein